MHLYTTKEKETGFPGPQTGLCLRPTGLPAGHKQDKRNIHLAEATGHFSVSFLDPSATISTITYFPFCLVLVFVLNSMFLIEV